MQAFGLEVQENPEIEFSNLLTDYLLDTSDGQGDYDCVSKRAAVAR
jgi:hypothetical protein